MYPTKCLVMKPGGEHIGALPTYGKTQNRH